MEVPLLLWRGKKTFDCSSTTTQHIFNPLRQLWCLQLHVMSSLTQSSTCSWSAQDRKLYSLQLNLLSAGITARYARYQWMRNQEVCWLRGSHCPSLLCCLDSAHKGWELIKHLSLSGFLLGWVGFFFFGMRLQTTFLLGHLNTAKHIFSIPWSGSQDNIKPVNCSNWHKGRDVAVVKSFVGDAHHMDHLLLDSSSWSHQTFNQPRECMLQVKLLRNLPANLHKLINACTFSKLLTH